MLMRGLLWFFLSAHVCSQPPIDAHHFESEFNQLSQNPQILSKLMLQLPKGADLHLHVSGAIRTEALIEIAKKHHYCLGPHDEILSDCRFGQPIDTLLSTQGGQQQLLQSWSMYHFHPTPKEDGKSHFFETFGKFRNLTRNHRAEIVAKILNEAALQHIQYLELMLPMVSDRPIADTHSMAFQREVQKNVLYFENLYLAAYRNANLIGQKLTFSWIIEINREQPIEQFKSDARYAFTIAHQSPHVAAVNMVMPEYGHYSHEDYLHQMQWIQNLKQVFPDVPVVLHAGEIPEDFAKLDKVGHVASAIQIAHPFRIGHGVSIVHEKDYEALMEHMKQSGTAVEINLTSNADILGIVGKQHPLGEYLKHQVPVVISSDDPGVSRWTLSKEYVRAFQEQHLSLATLIQLNRNSLTYSLLPGPSMWQDAEYQKAVPECQDLNSKSCDSFVQASPRAKQQRELEYRLIEFFKTHFSKKVLV